MKLHFPLSRLCGLTAIAASALSATCPAWAQSSVQIYGVVDVGVEVNQTGAPGASSQWLVNSGNLAANRLGFRGTEDLGGGLKALFNLEAQLNADTGAQPSFPDAPGSFFGRRSVVGLQGGFGEILLGRDYTPGFWTVWQSDRFRYGLPGTISTASQIGVTRASNGIFYKSPSIAGLIGRLAYSFGQENTAAPRDQGRVLSGSLEFRRGDLFLSAAVQRRRDLVPGSTTTSTDFREAGFGGEYKAGSWTFNAGYWGSDPVTAAANAVDKTRAFWLGAGVAVGAGQVNLQATRTVLDVIGRGEGRALTYGVAYTYPLSKRTTLYAAHGRVINDGGSRLALNTGSQRVGGTVFGADPRASVVGVRHSF